ncbi:MAG: hypothetical protein ACE5EI_05550 [Thermodesulfobacteriota bacterium]
MHLVITSVEVTGTDGEGKEIFAQELGGWYLLAGVSRRYTATIPRDVCGNLDKITIKVGTDRLDLEGGIDAAEIGCAPPGNADGQGNTGKG